MGAGPPFPPAGSPPLRPEASPSLRPGASALRPGAFPSFPPAGSPPSRPGASPSFGLASSPELGPELVVGAARVGSCSRYEEGLPLELGLVVGASRVGSGSRSYTLYHICAPDPQVLPTASIKP